MAILKCKMCGGELNVADGTTVVECEYCGTKQTVPTSKDENLQGLFNRANILRMKSEFDKAEQIYEKIIQNDETQAEAYWGLILCKYGIEYVEDPTTFKRIPTCHRTSFESVTADEDYKSALSYADAVQRDMYEAEAKEIDRLQKEILALSEKEEPYDVFICYKETDNDGKRTQDSVIANDIYHQLKQEGLKVFYAAITLEDKLGQEYEPYIFAALNSAKVMLVIGTKPEYFNAVWVKNEWSRYLKIIQKDRTKTLIPCYRDMDAYELPEEFAHLQAQDMSKIGFINDVVRGIKKVVENEDKNEVTTNHLSVENANGNVKAFLDRGFMALEDHEWKKADDFFEQALNFDAKLAQAYLGKLMVELKVRNQDDLQNCENPFDDNSNFQKAIRFGDDNLKNRLNGYITTIIERIEEKRQRGIFASAKQKMDTAKSEKGFLSAAEEFETISDYKNAKELAEKCREKAETTRKDAILKKADSALNDFYTAQENDTNLYLCKEVIVQLEGIKGYKDASEKIVACQERIDEIKKVIENKRIENENFRIERERKEEERKRLQKKIAIISAIAVIAAIAFGIVWHIIDLDKKYNEANSLLEQEKTIEAYNIFRELGSYKNSGEKVKDLIIKIANKISAGDCHTVGLKSDGTVVAVGDNGHGQCNVSDWTDIVAISADIFHTVGLKSDGTVVAVGDNRYGQCNVSDWTDIVAVFAGECHTVGLKSDGTVVAVGDNRCGQCNVSDWTDIVAVSAGDCRTVGLKSDGTVVAVGNNAYGRCDVSGWNLFK